MNEEFDKGYQSGYDAGYRRARIDYGLEDDECADCISRFLVNSAYFKYLAKFSHIDEIAKFKKVIDALQTVQPKREVEE